MKDVLRALGEVARILLPALVVGCVLVVLLLAASR